MKSSEVYPSKYLKAEDLDEDIVVTIELVELQEVGTQQKKEQKPVAHFRETEKSLIINKTNWKQIAKQHGDDSDDWTGKQITLAVMDVEFQGDIVAAIRVKAPRAAAKPVVAVKPTASTAPDEDAVTAFWTTVRSIGGDRKVALEFLTKKHNGDYAAADKALREDPTLI